jgi:hypothetical protein
VFAVGNKSIIRALRQPVGRSFDGFERDIRSLLLRRKTLGRLEKIDFLHFLLSFSADTTGGAPAS